MSHARPLVLLVQLPIPPPGPEPIRGNVSLAAAYLKVFARRRGLDDRFDIQILRAALANTLGDQGLVEEILGRSPQMVGLTCYLWNIDRSLWLAGELKRQCPELTIVLGGPEITPDNDWVLGHPTVDFAVIGEGEQTFAELLAALAAGPLGDRAVPGLWQRSQGKPPPARVPLASLEEIASVYLDGILDAAEERMMLLETVRGCRFRCKFCYYPKSSDAVRFLSPEWVQQNLAHAAERGVREVFLLDPTLNQRPDFLDFLGLLARGNPDRQFTYSAELRAEGIKPEHARLMRQANFAEVEIGLQSLDPRAQELMNRKVSLKALERGARAMLDEGIRVRVDLIVGLPGDTADSVRRGIEYLRRTRLYTEVQVFNLSILPGTAFRHEAAEMGLSYQPRPPYYVLRTPTLSLEEIYALMEEAQEAFGIEFDPFPAITWDLLRQGQGTAAHRVVDFEPGRAAPEFPPGPVLPLPPGEGRGEGFPVHERPGTPLDSPPLTPDPSPARGEGRHVVAGLPTEPLGRPNVSSLADGDEPTVAAGSGDPRRTAGDPRRTASGSTGSARAGSDRVKALTPTLSQRERGSLRAPAQAFTLPPAQAFTLWLRSADFHAQRHAAAGLIRTVLDENPHTTLQVVLEPTGDAERLTIATLAMLLEACYRTTSYLDRYYSLHPGRLLGAKRLLILLPAEKRAHVHPDWISATAEYATLVWHGGSLAPGELLEHECAIL